MVEGKFEKEGGDQIMVCICWALSAAGGNQSTITTELSIKKNYSSTRNWKVRIHRFRYGWI